MKKFIPHIFFTLLMTGFIINASATTCETTQGGYFGENIWSCSNGETFETADTLIINHDVEMKNNTVYTIQASTVIMRIGYSMEFLANSKLIMTTAGAEIVLENNSIIFTNNNASQTLIEINNISVWGGSNCTSCNNDPMSGPDVINEYSSPGNNSLLPIELISFQAQKSVQGVSISWSTAEEVNNDFFTLYRSTDTKEWEEIATVNGAGTSYENRNYKILDREANSGTVYYRMKQTDFDGKFKYFDVTSITLDNLELSFYPNPASDFIQLNAAEGDYLIEIMDLSGRIVLNSSLNGNQQLDISTLPAGAYHISLIGSSNIITKKLIVQ